MAQFRYKALSPSGEVLTGVMDAANAADVATKLQDAGNLPMEATPADAGGGGGLGRLLSRQAMNPKQVLQFTQQLGTLLGAGQPLDRALQILLDLPESEAARRLIGRVRDAVRGGTSLANALEQQHGAFSKLYINMIRAGEAGGSLHDSLDRLAEYLERSQALKSSVINALIYPALLMAMVFGTLLLLLGYVVPQFLPLFADLEVELPFLTRAVLGIGNVVAKIWWLLIAAPIAIGALLMRWLKDPANRLRFDGWILGFGLLGKLLLRVETARVARTLGTLIRNGVPLLSAMTIARNVAANHAIAAALETASGDVKTGGGLATSLGKTKRFPPLALQMIAVGEESGALDTMLLRVAETFDTETRHTIDRMLAALVPIITIIMAGVVAMIMFAILVPIFSLTNAVG